MESKRSTGTKLWQGNVIWSSIKLSHQVLPVEGLDIRDELFEERGEPVKDLIIVPLGDGDP